MTNPKTFTCLSCGQAKTPEEVQTEHLRLEMHITTNHHDIRAKKGITLCRPCQLSLAQDLRPYREDFLSQILSRLTLPQSERSQT